jgi:LuxR family maltose regulon positive regulatory protein
LGELDITLGRLRQAEQTFRSALQLANQSGAPGLTITGALHVGLSEVLLQWGQLEEGLQQVRAGIELGLLDGSLGVRLCGYTRLAAMAQALGDPEEAGQALKKAMSLAPSLRQTAFIAHMDLQGRLWWIQGDPSVTQRWVDESGLRPDGEISWRNEAGFLTLARLLIRLDKPEEAGRLLVRLRQAAENAGRNGRLVEVLALLALISRAKGEHAAALTTLQECLVLAEPEGYLEFFLDEGEPMRSLVGEFRSWIEKLDQDGPQSDRKSLREYAEKLLAAFPASAALQASRNGREKQDKDRQPFVSGTIQALSDRELEILRLIAAGLSNQEIARELVLATSTVHWHTKNIYSKLNVHSRTQATWQARQLGLVN